MPLSSTKKSPTPCVARSVRRNSSAIPGRTRSLHWAKRPARNRTVTPIAGSRRELRDFCLGPQPNPPGSQKSVMLKRTAIAGALLALIATVATPLGAAAEESGYRKNVGDYSVYLAVMPAEVIRGPLAPDDAAASPYRSAEARDTHPVMVSIFETRDRRRVTDARGMARGAALGFSGGKKALEPTAGAGAAVYGGFFPMMGR